MIYAVMPKEDYEHACDVLREYTGEDELIKSGELPENIDKVYDAGSAAGEEKGYSIGYSAGHAQGVIDGVAKTNDATLTPGKAPEGETFWSGGKKQTGTVKVALGGISQIVTPALGFNNGEECVMLSHTPTEKLFLDPAQGSVTLKAELTAFGDADADEVAKGKTFTAADGFLKQGTGKAIGDAYESGYKAGYADGDSNVSYREEPYKGGIKIIIG